MKITALGNIHNTGDVFADVIRPVKEDMSQQTGETSFFATPYRNQAIYREATFPQHSISVRSIRGIIVPMYCTSLRKIMLSFMDNEQIEQIIEEGLKPFTENTITDAVTFQNELKTIRRNGYATDNMEYEYGMNA